MKNREIIATINGLNELIADQNKVTLSNPATPRMPATVTFAIFENKKKLIEKYKVYMESLEAINSQYNVKLDENGSIDIKNLNEDDRSAHANALKELQDIDVKINFRKIHEKDFGMYEPLLKELEILSFMINPK